MSLLKTSLCKRVALSDDREVRDLSVVLLEAFLACLPVAEGGSGSILSSLRYSWFCGPAVSWSWAYQGIVLDTPAALAKCSRTGADLKVALFDVSLEQWLTSAHEAGVAGVDGYVVETSVEHVHALRSWELSKFQELATALLEAEVQVLACQKLVDPWLSDYLRERGTHVLSRLSMRHIDHLRQLSGAVPVTSLTSLPHSWADVVGVVGSVEARTICDRSYTLVGVPKVALKRGAAVTTLLVGAPDDHALSELRRCVPQASMSLDNAAQSGTAFLGGGLTEVYLADHLTRRATSMTEGSSSVDRDACRVVLSIAQCLLDVVWCLAPPVGDGKRGGPMQREGFLTRVREELARYQAEGEGRECLVLDASGPKARALVGALDLAGVLIRLGKTVDLSSIVL